VTLNLGSKVIGTDTDRSATYDFLLTFHNNHGPISYRFRDKRRFQSKIANFPVYFVSPLKGFPWDLSNVARGQKTRITGLGPRKNFDDIFSRLDTIHQRDGRTDGQTRCHSKDRASRRRAGKNCSLSTTYNGEMHMKNSKNNER